jgi:predicted transcriptional regulator
MDSEIRELRAEFRRLQKQITNLGLISHGYVQDRGPGAGGPNYQWSRKENKKTVSVALSAEQYEAMKQAIENWRQVQKTLKRMQQVSRALIFKTTPDTTRRKPLSEQVLGIN